MIPLSDDLNKEWNPDGFLGQLRLGHFDEAGLRRVKDLIARIPTHDDDGRIDRRLVALSWCIPTFMRWQRTEVFAPQGRPTAALDEAIAHLQAVLEQTLGVP